MRWPLLFQVDHLTNPRPHAGMAPTRLPSGPGAGQIARGRAALNVALTSTANREHRQGRPNHVLRAAVPTPQILPDVPLIGLTEPNVGTDMSRPHLPGRQPAAGWDGEPGASSPIRY